MIPGTQYDVDNKCRVLLNNNVALNKVFACGIGFPVRTNDGKTVQSAMINDKNKKMQQRAMNPRADGFSLYMNIVGDILIKNILPKDQKLKGLSHKVFPPLDSATSFKQTSIMEKYAKSPLKIPMRDPVEKHDLVTHGYDKVNPMFMDSLKK